MASMVPTVGEFYILEVEDGRVPVRVDSVVEVDRGRGPLTIVTATAPNGRSAEFTLGEWERFLRA